ncbi:MAG TPA: hypothetical protein VHV57_06290 [Acidimicrobiales bacterium]|nr:hypothetical protein [Acidimicrobiales bacterium]
MIRRFAAAAFCGPALALLTLSGGLTSSAGADTPAAPPSPGYWVVTAGGSGVPFNAPQLGSPATTNNDVCEAGPAYPFYGCLAVAGTPTHQGYLVGGTGPDPKDKKYFGDTEGFGTGGECPTTQAYGPFLGLNAVVVGLAIAPTGFWLVGADGGIFTACGANFYGSMGDQHLNKQVVGMASTPDGFGYWLVASDGGIFTFGDAPFLGSLGALKLNSPVVGIVPTPDGGGYYMVAKDGGVFTFGDAPFEGSLGNLHLAKPISGMALNPDGPGYWLVGTDGGVFALGGAPFLGSAAGLKLDAPVVGIVAKS